MPLICSGTERCLRAERLNYCFCDMTKHFITQLSIGSILISEEVNFPPEMWCSVFINYVMSNIL